MVLNNGQKIVAEYYDTTIDFLPLGCKMPRIHPSYPDGIFFIISIWILDLGHKNSLIAQNDL